MAGFPITIPARIAGGVLDTKGFSPGWKPDRCDVRPALTAVGCMFDPTRPSCCTGWQEFPRNSLPPCPGWLRPGEIWSGYAQGLLEFHIERRLKSYAILRTLPERCDLVQTSWAKRHPAPRVKFRHFAGSAPHCRDSKTQASLCTPKTKKACGRAAASAARRPRRFFDMRALTAILCFFTRRFE